MPRLIPILLSILLSFCAVCGTQEQAAGQSQEEPSGGAGLSAERLQAAERLLEVTKMAESMREMIDSALREQMTAVPEMKAYEDIIEGFFHKYLTWEAFKAPMTRTYAESFTTAELEDLIAFYQTPTGRKTVRILPEIFQKSSSIGREVVEEHQAELIEAIQERAAELQAQRHAGAQQGGSRPAGGGRIILALPEAEVEEISAEELVALDRKGERKVLELAENSSFQNENGFPVEDQLQNEYGRWDAGKLREFLPPGSKIDVQYFVQGNRLVLHLVEKRE